MQQLATLLDAGIPILQALDVIYQGCEKPVLKKLLLAIKNNIRQGNLLSKTLKKYPKIFDHLTCQLIAIGEQSGTLDTMLKRMIQYKKKTADLKNKVKKALLYPCTVVVTAVIVTSILLIFVIPQFESLFSGFGAQLPLLTRMVIQTAHFLKFHWWWILFCFMIPITLIKFLKQRNKKFAIFLDKHILHIPIFGQMIKKSIIARLMRTLATTFSIGVPLLEALQTLKGIANNLAFSQALVQVHDNIQHGQPLHKSLQKCHLFPIISIQMVAIGEETGKLDDMLETLADFYETQIDRMVNNLNQLLEPLIMGILGIFIGGLVIAMYLPIFKLGTAI